MMKFVKKYYKAIIPIGLIGILFLLYGMFTYVDYVKPAREAGYAMVEIHKTHDEKTYKLEEDSIVEQEFLSTENEITMLRLKFETNQVGDKGNVKVQIIRNGNGEIVEDHNVAATELKKAKNGEVDILTSISNARNTIFTVKVELEEFDDGKTPNIYLSGMAEVFGKLEIQGEYVEEENMSMVVYSGNCWQLSHMYALFLLIIIGGVMIMVMIIYSKRFDLHLKFAVLAFVIGMIYSIVLPSTTIPDDTRHLAWAYNVSNFMMGKDEAHNEEGTVYMREGDLWICAENRYPDFNTYLREYKGFLRTDKEKKLVDSGVESVGVIQSIAYLPQALGMTIARIFKWGTVPMLFLGRLLAAFVYAVLCYFTIKKIPIYKTFMGALVLLPMIAWSGASFSYDMYVNGMSFLYIAWMIKLANDTEVPIQKRDIFFTGIMLAAVCSIKAVYICLAFLYILIPYKRRKRKLTDYKGVLFVIGFGILGACASRGIEIIQLFLRGNEHEAAIRGTALYSVDIILEKPYLLFTMMTRAIMEQGTNYFEGILGLMGWLNIKIPSGLGIGFLLILLVSIMYTKQKEIEWVDIKIKTLFSIIIVGTVFLVHLAMLFAFTEVTERCIRGVQGRYFFPVFPLIMLLFTNRNIIVKKDITKNVMIGNIILHMLVYFYLIQSLFVGIFMLT